MITLQIIVTNTGWCQSDYEREGGSSLTFGNDDSSRVSIVMRLRLC